MACGSSLETSSVLNAMKSILVIFLLLLTTVNGYARTSPDYPAMQNAGLNSGYSAVVYGAGGRSADLATDKKPAALNSIVRSEVPEPHGWSMLILGLGLVVIQSMRRRKKQASWG